jgi:hypothetical protein
MDLERIAKASAESGKQLLKKEKLNGKNNTNHLRNGTFGMPVCGGKSPENLLGRGERTKIGIRNFAS